MVLPFITFVVVFYFWTAALFAPPKKKSASDDLIKALEKYIKEVSKKS